MGGISLENRIHKIISVKFILILLINKSILKLLVANPNRVTKEECWGSHKPNLMFFMIFSIQHSYKILILDKLSCKLHLHIETYH